MEKIHRIELDKSGHFLEIYIDGKKIEYFEIDIEQEPDNIPIITIKAPFEIKKDKTEPV